MLINKDSLHYRFITWGGDTAPKNLCPYVRWLLVKGVALFVASVACLLLFVSMLTLPWTWDVIEYKGFMALGLMGWGVSGLLGFGWGCFELKDYLYDRKLGKPKKPPGLVKSYIKAKHDKICPILEFKD